MKFLLVIWVLAVCSSCQPKQTILQGHINNYRGELVVLKCYESELQDTLQVDATGHFSWTPEKVEKQVYGICVTGYQPWRIPMHLTPGDQEKLEIWLSPDKTMQMKYAGDRAAENQYRLAFDELEQSMIGYDAESRNLSFVAYKAKLDEMERDMQPLLNRIADPDIKSRFTKKQHLWFQHRRTAYASILTWRLREGGEAADDDFNAFFKSLDLNNPDECSEYMLQDIIGWQQAQDPGYKAEERNISYLNWLDRLVSNQKMKNECATKHMKGVIRNASGRSLDAEMQRYKQICTDDPMEVEEQYKEYLRVYNNLMPGKPAPDFELIDVKGKKCRLSDLKGTYVFMDVWATWCKGCVMEIPYMEKLQEHFAHDKRITLISISWDYTQKVWLDYLEKRPATWPQYIVDKENMEVMKREYRMTFIPRFLLLDKDGKIISLDAPLPSSPDIIEYIDRQIR